MPPITAQAQRDGVTAALVAYTVWGFFPLMFLQLEGVDPVLIVAHRIVWSLVVVGAILLLRNRLGEVSQALRDPQVLWRLGASTIFVAINWLTYVWAVENDRVLETSFGYFLNPLVNVLLGMLLLGERQNRWQWVAIAIASVAMVLQTIGLNGFPVAGGGDRGDVRVLRLHAENRKGRLGAGSLRRDAAADADLDRLHHLHDRCARPWAARDRAWMVLADLYRSRDVADAAALRLRRAAAPAHHHRDHPVHRALDPVRPRRHGISARTSTTMRLVSFALIWLSLVIFTVDSIRRARAPVPVPQP